MVITGNSREEVEKFIANLSSCLPLKDLSNLSYFFGVVVKRTPTGDHLSQQKNILDLLVKALMLKSKPLPTPISSFTQLFAYKEVLVSDP